MCDDDENVRAQTTKNETHLDSHKKARKDTIKEFRFVRSLRPLRERFPQPGPSADPSFSCFIVPFRGRSQQASLRTAAVVTADRDPCSITPSHE